MLSILLQGVGILTCPHYRCKQNVSIGLYKRCMVSCLVSCLALPQISIAKMTTSKSRNFLAAQSTSPMNHTVSNNANVANATVTQSASSSAKKPKSSMSIFAHKIKSELIGGIRKLGEVQFSNMTFMNLSRHYNT